MISSEKFLLWQHNELEFPQRWWSSWLTSTCTIQICIVTEIHKGTQRNTESVPAQKLEYISKSRSSVAIGWMGFLFWSKLFKYIGWYWKDRNQSTEKCKLVLLRTYTFSHLHQQNNWWFLSFSNVRMKSVSSTTRVSVQFGGNAGNFYCDTINPSNSALLIYPLFRCLFILRGLFTRRVELWRANGVEEIKKMSTSCMHLP